MDESFIIVALAPFYALTVVGVSFATAYLVRSFMDSAVETQLKETLNTPK